MAKTQQARLLALPPEPWGRRMKRAREDVADLTLLEAADLIGRWIFTSDTTISRLEALPDIPPSRKRRALAYVACWAYGVDPTELGLSDDALPPGVVTDLAKSPGASAQSR